jgi:hypothetical protein
MTKCFNIQQEDLLAPIRHQIGARMESRVKSEKNVSPTIPNRNEKFFKRLRCNLKKFVTMFAIATSLTGCSSSAESGALKPRTEKENQAIYDSWYPIKNEECQLIADSFSLIGSAIGSGEIDYLSQNMDEINERLRLGGDLASASLLDLSQKTIDDSIRAYTLEAVPILARIGDLIAEDSTDFGMQLDYLQDFMDLTGRVPNGCKS